MSPQKTMWVAGMAVDGDDVPDPFAAQVGLGEVVAVVAVVTEEVLGDSVGDDFVHVDGNARRELGLLHLFLLCGERMSAAKCGHSKKADLSG